VYDVARAGPLGYAASMPAAPEIHQLANRALKPLLVYRGVLPLEGDAASSCEDLFERHGWGGGWRNGIFGYDHFHATAHEVLGIVRGRVRVRFGGDGGVEAEVLAGDVVVIPAGVAHRNLGASRDLMVIGAYPGGQHPDRNTGTPDAQALDTVTRVALPSQDPVYGAGGPLRAAWGAAS
jgi:uncharacterized protein YjlB